MKEITIKVAEIADLRIGIIDVLKKIVEHDGSIRPKLNSVNYDDPYGDVLITMYGYNGSSAELKVSRQPYMVRGTMKDLKNIAGKVDDSFRRLELEDEECNRYAYFFVDSALMDAVLDALEVIRTSFKDAVRLG